MSALRGVSRLFAGLRVTQAVSTARAPVAVVRTAASTTAPPAPSRTQTGLMEFFDDKKNWGEMEIQVGRSWRVDELRIKSNGDLHKLWFVLLKEKNMLLTMEHECDRQLELFPNPERIDKVEESMKNLETVVRERNKAYHLLETGEDGERPVRTVVNQLGIKYNYKLAEHLIPHWMNTYWRNTRKFRYEGMAVYKFRKALREKYAKMPHEKKNKQIHAVCKLLRRFPNVDESLLKEKYPDVDIDKVRHYKIARGHFFVDRK